MRSLKIGLAALFGALLIAGPGEAQFRSTQSGRGTSIRFKKGPIRIDHTFYKDRQTADGPGIGYGYGGSPYGGGYYGGQTVFGSDDAYYASLRSARNGGPVYQDRPPIREAEYERPAPRPAPREHDDIPTNRWECDSKSHANGHEWGDECSKDGSYGCIACHKVHEEEYRCPKLEKLLVKANGRNTVPDRYGRGPSIKSQPAGPRTSTPPTSREPRQPVPPVPPAPREPVITDPDHFEPG